MRMNKLIIALCIIVIAGSALRAQSPSQQITALQYYFDTDPGAGVPGNGAIIQVTPAETVSQTYNIAAGDINGDGFHQLYIRGIICR